MNINIKIFGIHLIVSSGKKNATKKKNIKKENPFKKN